MKIIHINSQRYDFIRSQGYSLAIPDGMTAAGVYQTYEDGDVVFHLLDGERGICSECGVEKVSVDANDPAEMETVKMSALPEDLIVALRDMRQDSVLALRRFHGVA